MISLAYLEFRFVCRWHEQPQSTVLSLIQVQRTYPKPILDVRNGENAIRVIQSCASTYPFMGLGVQKKRRNHTNSLLATEITLYSPLETNNTQTVLMFSTYDFGFSNHELVEGRHGRRFSKHTSGNLEMPAKIFWIPGSKQCQ